jgi:HEAT repeat protein
MNLQRTVLLMTVSLAVLCGRVALADEVAKVALPADLNAADESVKLQAIEQWSSEGEKAAPAVLPLAQLLKDKSSIVRARAAHALGKIGVSAIPAATSLAEATKDADPVVRQQAVRAIIRIRPGTHIVVPVCIALFADSDPAVRLRALHAVVDAGAPAVPMLIATVKKDDDSAYGACLALRDMGRTAEAAIPALVEELQDTRPEIRREAILTLAAMDAAAASVADKIAATLKDEPTQVAATYALGRIGVIPKDAEVTIQANTKSDNKLLSASSYFALANTHPKNKEIRGEATEKLIGLLKDKDAFVRVAAAQGLAALPPNPKVTGPIWEKAFQDADETTILNALDALTKLGKPAVPRLIDALKIEKCRAGVLYVLGRIGPDAVAAVPQIIPLVEDKNERVAKEAILTLAAIGPGAKEAVPALIKALEQSENPNGPAAAFALGKIGPDAASAEEALVKQVDGKDKALALASAWALVTVKPASEETAKKLVPMLVASLSDATPLVRQGAADALGKLGPAAKEAVPALKNVAKMDADREVRATAIKALKAIDGKVKGRKATPSKMKAV